MRWMPKRHVSMGFYSDPIYQPEINGDGLKSVPGQPLILRAVIRFLPFDVRIAV